MQDFLKVMGMVIGSFPVNEYDKRIVILTRECGKITAFVKGARRQGSRFLASTDLFCFGTFELFVGRNSYNVQNAEISNFFECFRDDIVGAYYGMYFMELIDFYTRENNDSSMELLLLYRALQGLKSDKLDNLFVKTIFELKLFIVEGELIPLEKIGNVTDKAYSVVMNHIYNSDIEGLFNFKVEEDVLNELIRIADYERKHLIDRPIKSLSVLETL